MEVDFGEIFSLVGYVAGLQVSTEVGILLPNNQRQHRSLHIQKDVLTYALC